MSGFRVLLEHVAPQPLAVAPGPISHVGGRAQCRDDGQAGREDQTRPVLGPGAGDRVHQRRGRDAQARHREVVAVLVGHLQGQDRGLEGQVEEEPHQGEGEKPLSAGGRDGQCRETEEQQCTEQRGRRVEQRV
jgi:hypothetical protein